MAELTVGPIDFSSLLDELESGSSGSCANVIRKLREYEVAAYEAGQGGPTGELIANFLARLDTRVANREFEVEKTCSHNYENFVESVKELLLVQEKAEELQRALYQIRSNIETSIEKLHDSSESLIQTHTTLDRMDQCIAALCASLPVLNQYEKVERCIAEGRYYHALKTLEYLEHYQLNSVKSYAFSESLAKRIPELRAEIKTASLTQLTDFLEEVRKHSTRLGAIAMHQVAEKMGILKDVNCAPISEPLKSNNLRASAGGSDSDVDAPSVPIQTRNSCSSRATRPNRLDVELNELALAASASERQREGDQWRSAKNNIEELIDFGPIYRCLHIHCASGERSEFEHYYFIQRKKQCQLILSLSPSQQTSMRNYSEFFSRVVGFFLVDDYLRHTMPGAASYYQSFQAELWAMIVPRLAQLVSRNATNCRTTQELLGLKHACVLFERTMANLGFHTAGLHEMLEIVRKQYSSLLIAQWREKFEEILKSDNYTAIALSSPSDLTPVLAAYPYCQSAEFTALRYPLNLVFSEMVPRVYAAIRDYIDASVEFIVVVGPSGGGGSVSTSRLSLDGVGTGVAWTELEDALNRATNALFTDCLGGLLGTTIEAARSDLLRLVQLTINLSELESACEHLQTYLHENARPNLCLSSTSSKKKNSVVDDDPAGMEEDMAEILFLMASQPEEVQPSRSHLYGVSLFRDARARAETQIYTNLNSRIDEFCSLASYDGIFGGPGEGDTSRSLDELEASAARGVKRLPTSDYMRDMTAWLGSTFRAFSHLPPKVAHTACISVCKYIVKILQRILMGPEVKMVAEPALSLMLADLEECDKFARSDPVPGIDKFILLLIFQELRQLLELVKKDDWNVFFANYGKPSGNPYDRVTPVAATTLLELMREAEKKRSSFIGSMMSKGERERRKRLEDLMKQLKDLQAGSAAYGRRS